MFTRSEVLAFLRKLQRPMIMVLALALMVNAWSLGPVSDCGEQSSCASRAAVSLDDSPAAVLGALQSIEEIRADLDSAGDALVDVAFVFKLTGSSSARVAGAGSALAEGRHQFLPQKTGPPFC